MGKIVELLIIKNLYFIVLLPLLAGAITLAARNFNFAKLKETALFLTGTSVFASLALSSVALLHCIKSPGFLLENTFKWFNLGYSKISVDIGVLVDKTSAITGLITACLCLGVFIFLMKRREEFPDTASRCLMLDIVMFVLFSLLYSSNLLQAIFLGMLVSVLIFIYMERRQGFELAQKLFTSCAALDMVFLFCAMMLVYHAYNFDITQGIGLLSFVNVDYWALAISGLSDNFVFSFFVTLFLAATILKILSIFLVSYLSEKNVFVLLFSILTALCIATQLGVRLFPLYTLSNYPLWLIVLVLIFVINLKRLGNLLYNILKKADTFLEVVPEVIFLKSLNLVSGCLAKKEEAGIKFYFIYAAVTIIVLFVVLALVYHRIMKV